MRILRAVPALALVVAGLSLTAPPAHASYQPAAPVNATIFYPVEVPTQSRYHPTQTTDSKDVEAIRRQVTEMQYAGQNAALYSWDGRTSFAEREFGMHLRAADDSAFRWAILDELEGAAGPNGGDPTAAQIKADLDHLYRAYGSDASYLHLGGKPVLFAYNDAGDTCNMATRWSQANAGRFYLVLKVVPRYTTCSQPSAWWGYDPSQRGFAAGNSYQVSPGFFRYSESSARLGRSVASFAAALKTMKASSARFKITTTWNEWYDGTSVASAREWASGSGHGSYVDQMHSVLGQAGDVPAPPAAVSSSTNGQSIDLSWSASTGATSYQVFRNGCLAATVTGTTWSDTAFTDASASYFVKAVNARGTSRRSPVRLGTAGTPSAAPTSTGNEGLAAVNGQRLVLTTTGTGWGCNARQRGQAVFTAPASVPAGATGLVLAVHAVSPLGAGGITLYPMGATAPALSQVRYYSTRASSNTVVVGLGTGRQVVVQESGAATHLIVDLIGYLAPGEQGVVADTLGGRTVLTNSSSSAAGTTAVALPANIVPADARAVQVRLQMRSAPAAGYATLYAGSASRPGVTSLQYAAANMMTTSVLVPVDSSRRINVFHSTGGILTVGLEGWTTASGAAVAPAVSSFASYRGTSETLTFPTEARGHVAMLNLGVASATGYGTLGLTPYGGKTVMAQVNYGPQQPQSGFTWIRVPANGVVGVSSSQVATLSVDQLALG